ncbi:squalene cyclase [Gryllotalpicola reticulitermitis]|uniref:Squalene cyclase n=1 Tax=Gryllotalpicola reticulitermitis TaxID=1184153 RepID=A0ABV8Q3G3_9MICO
MDQRQRDWLLDSDPALRWQVERDLVGAADDVWEATRARVAAEGFGARLLALQDPDGQWAGGAFFPADFDFHGPETAPGAGQPWTATTWSLNALREWGVPASVLGDTAARLAENSHWEYDGAPYWQGEVDCCINAWTLMNGAWLGVVVRHLASWFVEHQMPDGGWNCEWVDGATRSSVASTLNTLEGLLFYERAGHGSAEITEARHAGEEYLLSRRLMYRLSDGSLIAPWVTRLAYPFRHFYSTLHALDYFRAAALFDGTAPDAQLDDAIASVRSAPSEGARWLQGRRHPGRVWFEVDVDAGEPSKWLTFYAERVLTWWDGR